MPEGPGQVLVAVCAVFSSVLPCQSSMDTTGLSTGRAGAPVSTEVGVTVLMGDIVVDAETSQVSGNPLRTHEH